MGSYQVPFGGSTRCSWLLNFTGIGSNAPAVLLFLRLHFLIDHGFLTPNPPFTPPPAAAPPPDAVYWPALWTLPTSRAARVLM